MGMTDDRLAHLLNNIPPRSLLLLEDIDAAFPDRKMDKQAGGYTECLLSGYRSSLTFSGLLNALDGVAASEERLIFMTTNYPDKLDAALIRPGRVDQKYYVGNATEKQAREMFLKFYDGQSELAETFVYNLRDANLFGTVSTAQLQGHFVFHREDAEKAAHMIDTLLPAK
jgi:mitochondrial chaperone BCS1